MMVRDVKVWLLRYLAKIPCRIGHQRVEDLWMCARRCSRKTEVLPIPCPICVQFSMTQKVSSGSKSKKASIEPVTTRSRSRKSTSPESPASSRCQSEIFRHAFHWCEAGSVIGGSGSASMPGSSPAASSVKQTKRSGRVRVAPDHRIERVGVFRAVGRAPFDTNDGLHRSYSSGRIEAGARSPRSYSPSRRRLQPQSSREQRRSRPRKCPVIDLAICLGRLRQQRTDPGRQLVQCWPLPEFTFFIDHRHVWPPQRAKTTRHVRRRSARSLPRSPSTTEPLWPHRRRCRRQHPRHVVAVARLQSSKENSVPPFDAHKYKSDTKRSFGSRRKVKIKGFSTRSLHKSNVEIAAINAKAIERAPWHSQYALAVFAA